MQEGGKVGGVPSWYFNVKFIGHLECKCGGIDSSDHVSFAGMCDPWVHNCMPLSVKRGAFGFSSGEY
jgi:hypothetical protein